MTENTRRLLWMDAILTMATLFLVFAVLLIDRYYVNQEKLLESDNEIGHRPKGKKRISEPKIELLERSDNEVSDKLKERKEQLERFDIEIGDRLKEKERGKSQGSDSEKGERFQKPNEETILPKHKRSSGSYGTFLKRAERSQYMMLFQKHSESPPDKPLYTIAFYTPTLHYPALKSAYTLSPYKSTISIEEPPAAKSTARKHPSCSQLSFFDGNTPRSIKPPSPISDSKENTSQWDSPSDITDSQQIWILSPSPINGSKQNTPQYTASGSEQTPSAWLLSPIASANGQDTPKWVLSPEGKSREGSDLYSIYSPHLSVPISPPITPFIIELKTTPTPSEKKRSIDDIEDSRDSYSFSTPKSPA
jgi:hypothetical protein